jgi:hypothetical protein
MTYQLCPGDESLMSVIDRIVDGACAAAPGLRAADCRDLVDLIFRARVRQTTSCGKFEACRPIGVVWGAEPPVGWTDADPAALPEIFAIAAVALIDPQPLELWPLEQRLASTFRAILGPLLHHNPACGHAEICDAEPVFPLRTAARYPR